MRKEFGKNKMEESRFSEKDLTYLKEMHRKRRILNEGMPLHRFFFGEIPGLGSKGIV